MASFGWLDYDTARQNKEYRQLSKRLWNGGNSRMNTARIFITRHIMGNFFCVGDDLCHIHLCVCVSFFFPYHFGACSPACLTFLMADSALRRITCWWTRTMLVNLRLHWQVKKCWMSINSTISPFFFLTMLTWYIYYCWGPTTPWSFHPLFICKLCLYVFFCASLHIR